MTFPVLVGDGVLANPDTGELVQLSSMPPAFLADRLDELAEWSRQARSYRSMLEDELKLRLAEAGERTMDAGLFVVERTERREWDTDATWAALSDLVGAGVVSAKEADEAMPEVTVRKPSGVKLTALLGRLVGEGEHLELVGALVRARGSRVGVRLGRRAVEGSVEA